MLHRFFFTLLCVGLEGPMLLIPQYGAQAAPTQTQTEAGAVLPAVKLSFAPIVKQVQPAVVNVYASRQERRMRNAFFDDPFMRQFFGLPTERTARSLGSGVLVDPSGLVVTNNHVVEGMTDIKVALADKREFEAKVILRDPRSDLVVLKIQGEEKFPTISLGDSDSLEVGDFVVAIGNPFGVGQTVTQGIISAKARTQIGATDYQFFIQTDAAINPGNSGGALVDVFGKLVGINAAIFSKSGGNIGIGFAIPVNMVKIIITNAKGGRSNVRRPWFGAHLQIVSKDIAASLGLDRPMGALIANVLEGGAAKNAGIKPGDVILALEDQPIDDPDNLQFQLDTKPLGSSAKIQVLRNKTKLNLSVTLIAAPEIPERMPIALQNPSPFSGATVINLSPAVMEEFSLDTSAEGVLVSEIMPNSRAEMIGLQKGDIVVNVNDRKILSPAMMQEVTASAQLYWKLTLIRSNQIITTIIRN